MNILINTNSLKSSLHKITGVLSKNLSMPVISNVLIEKKKKQISITATNLEIQITVNADYLESDEFDPITVSGTKLYEIVRSLDNQDVQITTSKDNLVLKANTSSFKLSTLPAVKFPSFEEAKFLEEFTIKQTQLLDLLNKTSFSMLVDPDINFFLAGMLLVLAPNNLTAVTTDRHRLAISTTRLEKKQINNIECIVPRKAVLELIRILHGDGEAKARVGSNQMRVDFKDTSFISKLIDGKFPGSWRGVIPTTASIEILLEKQNIRSVLQRVSILADEKFKSVRIEATNETMTLSSVNHASPQEEAKETIKYQSSSTKPNKVNVGFNARYLLEAINACSGDKVEIGLNGHGEDPKLSDEQNLSARTKGTLISSPGDRNTKYVIMPTNL